MYFQYIVYSYKHTYCTYSTYILTQTHSYIHTYIHTLAYALLSDLYLHVATEFPDFAGQIVFTVSLNTDTLVDVLGRESEVGQGCTDMYMYMYVCMYI